MINPISAFFALSARSTDIRRAFALFSKNKAENTELIDIIRSVLGDLGVLEQQAPQSQVLLPASLRKYDTGWVQRSLNQLVDAKLQVDGQLGPTNPESATRRAVRKFQEAHPPLKVDGDPGVQTVGTMEAALSQQGA